MNTLKSIVTAVDFSACSDAALGQAIRIASWNTSAKAGVRAVHAIEPLMYDIAQPVLMFPVPSMNDLIGEADRRWKEDLAKWPELGEVQFSTVIGHPSAEIIHAATQNAAELICIGAHSTMDAARGVGAVGAGVARHAACDVLLVQARHIGPFRTIVACVDFSPTSLEAVESALRIAAQDSSQLHVVHAYREPWNHAAQTDDIARHMPDFAEKFRESVRASLEKFCSPLAHELKALRAIYHAIPDPSHARAIVRFAEAHSADLVVLGARGQSTLRQMVFGTTAEHVVREVRCSVLVIKPNVPEGSESNQPRAEIELLKPAF
ncbi:MAG: universal stress protein [Phycisphaerales bacterium]|nr:universal stress protein [Phycisphaerales bacterium]